MRYEHVPVRRRVVLTGLAGAVASAVLAACGESAPTNTPASTEVRGATIAPPAAGITVAPTAPAPTNTTASAAMTTVLAIPTTAPAVMVRRVTISYWHIRGSGVPMMMLNDIIRRFGESYPSITVEQRAYPNYEPLTQALQAALAARMPPSFAQIGYNYTNYVATNFPHLNIDEAVKRDPQGAEVLKNYAPNILDLGRVNGVLHGMTNELGTPFLYYNADLFAQAGIERPPRTWAEVRDVARHVRDKTGMVGLSMTETVGMFTHQGLIESNGARLLVGSGRDMRTGVDSPEAIAAMQLIADMTKEKTAAFLDGNQTVNTFSSGQLAMMLGTSSRLATIQQQAKFRPGTATFPVFDGKQRRVPAGGNALFIFATDPMQQQAAWEFIKFLHTPESLAAWSKATGFLPPRRDLATDPQYLRANYGESSLLRVELEQLGDTVPWVSWPGKNGLQVDKEFTTARERIFAGGEDVAATLRDTANRVSQLIRE